MAGITKAQVFNAADAISAAGQAPTVASIRAKLGTGSYTTITAMLRDWREQANTEPEEALDVPEEITQALGRAAEIVWKAAQDHFRHELATVKKESERAISEAQGQLADALAEIAELEKMADEQTGAIEQLKAEKEASREALDGMKSERAELTASLKAAEARIKEQGDLLRRMIPEPKAKAAPKPQAKQKPETKKPDQMELAGQG